MMGEQKSEPELSWNILLYLSLRFRPFAGRG
jgi:hypothetical protein